MLNFVQLAFAAVGLVVCGLRAVLLLEKLPSVLQLRASKVLQGKTARTGTTG